MRDNNLPLLQSLTEDLFMSRMKDVFIRMTALSNSRPEVPTTKIVFGGGMDPDGNANFFDKDDPIWPAFDSPAELEDCLMWMRLEKAKTDFASRFPSPHEFLKTRYSFAHPKAQMRLRETAGCSSMRL